MQEAVLLICFPQLFVTSDFNFFSTFTEIYNVTLIEVSAGVQPCNFPGFSLHLHKLFSSNIPFFPALFHLCADSSTASQALQKELCI